MGEAAGKQRQAALLDGPFRRLRDDNHVDSHRILIWDQQQQPINPNPEELRHWVAVLSRVLPR
jgi:hypothetical protein